MSENNIPDNVHEMSDEEFMNLDPSVFESQPEAEEDGSDDSDSVDDGDDSDSVFTDEEDSSEETDSDEEETDAEETEESEDEEDSDESEESDVNDDSDDSDDDDEEEVAAKEQLAQLFEPFRANGRDIQVSSVEEAKRLMQMGVNYNKKMHGLKPHLKTMRMLDNNGLMDEERLSFMIDLHNGEPEAIAKLIEEHKIDLDEFDESKASEYKPKEHSISDKEYEIGDVLSDLRSEASPDTYNQTLNVVKSLDDASKDVITSNPVILRDISTHIETGMYKMITDRIETDRVLGRLDEGKSFLAQYKEVGDTLNAEGKFDQFKSGKPPKTDDTETTKKRIVKPKPKSSVSSKRKKAAIRSGGTSTKTSSDFNPLELSDEEFEKQFNSNY